MSPRGLSRKFPSARAPCPQIRGVGARCARPPQVGASSYHPFRSPHKGARIAKPTQLETLESVPVPQVGVWYTWRADTLMRARAPIESPLPLGEG